jgi:hypothetical protein
LYKHHEYYNGIQQSDLIINGRTKTRKEVIHTKVLCKNRLDVSGGYRNLIGYFGLSEPTWFEKVKDEMLSQTEYLLEKHISETGKYPTRYYLNDNGVSQRFIENMGGLRQLFLLFGYMDYFNNRLPITEQISKDKIIKEFLTKYTDHTPTQKEVIDDYESGKFLVSGYAIAKYFYGFENFLYLIGKSPRGTGFGYSGIAKDGHKCDSASEIIIDDFLYTNNIPHEPHVEYSKIMDTDRKFISDFVLFDGTVVEFLGMSGLYKYDARSKEKMAEMNKNGVNYILISEKDLKRLDKVFYPYISKECG